MNTLFNVLSKSCFYTICPQNPLRLRNKPWSSLLTMATTLHPRWEDNFITIKPTPKEALVITIVYPGLSLAWPRAFTATSPSILLGPNC